MKIKSLILAAGSGQRMKSDIAKVLHKTAGKTLLEHVLDACREADVDETAVILGYQKDEVEKIVPEDVDVYYQQEQLGTGHAVKQAKAFFDGGDESVVLVLNGDAPLISPHTIDRLIEKHLENENGVTVLTAKVPDPTGYGRIIKEDDRLLRIVEQKDASEEERKIDEINSGVYCFNSADLLPALEKLTDKNSQKEYYLTDCIEIIRDMGKDVGTYLLEDYKETAAVNSRAQLAQVNAIFYEKKALELMDEGVTIIDPKNVYIDLSVKVGADTVIYPGCLIEGDTVIGKGCTIGLNSHIKNSTIKNSVQIESSTIIDSIIDEGSQIGPYAYLRPNSQIGKNVKVGDFVEVKNSVIGDGSKASHLTYIGDADVGAGVNLGCGTVFVNYDGKKKHRTVVEDNCFIGCNTNLIAPVTVRENSYTAAGSTITDEVPPNTLSIARSRQENKIDYYQEEE